MIMLSKDNNLSRKNIYFCKVKPSMMARFRIIPLLALLLAATFQSFAQDNPSFVRRTFDRLLAPSVELDPEAVYQPAARWTFALTGDLRHAGMSQTYSFTVATAKLDSEGNMIITEYPASLSSSLEGGMIESVGFQAGLGGLSLSLSKKFRGDGSNNTMSFDYMAAGYAFQLQYFKLSDPVRYDFVMGEPDDIRYNHQTGYTMNPGRMRALILDAFYAFNRRTFAYSAAYKSSVIQRRSAGSWMFGSKLILGDFLLDPSEDISFWIGGQALHTSAQVSVGAGYSYNLVPYHRQPHGDREEGLRNFTVNVTLLPMVTMFNQFSSTEYKLVESGEYVPGEKRVMNGNLLVNYVARAGASYTRDLFTVNLSASYDSYAYTGSTRYPYEGVIERNVDTSGDFRRWIVSLRLCRRF